MALFKKRNKIIDLTERNLPSSEFSSRPTSRPVFPIQKTATSQSQETEGFIFPADFNPSPRSFNSSSSSTFSNEYNDRDETPEEKRKKLTKRLLDMTDKIEDLSNQIYHLQQRIEVLERRLSNNRYE